MSSYFKGRNVFLEHKVWGTIVCVGEKKYLGLLNINGASLNEHFIIEWTKSMW